MPEWGFETRQIHAGTSPIEPLARGPSRSTRRPATSFATRPRGGLFGLQELGNIYTRIMNPTRPPSKIALRHSGWRRGTRRSEWTGRRNDRALELGENGGHIVSSASLYGGTYNLFHYTLPKSSHRGLLRERPRRPRSVAQRPFGPNTKASPETLGNSQGSRSTSRAWPRWPDNGIPLVVDIHVGDALPGPTAGARRRHRGALGHEVHRRSRNVDLAGVIVDGGTFNYEASVASPPSPTGPELPRTRFRRTPAPLFPARFVLKARLQYLRDVGAAITPFNSFLSFRVWRP